MRAFCTIHQTSSLFEALCIGTCTRVCFASWLHFVSFIVLSIEKLNQQLVLMFFNPMNETRLAQTSFLSHRILWKQIYWHVSEVTGNILSCNVYYYIFMSLRSIFFKKQQWYNGISIIVIAVLRMQYIIIYIYIYMRVCRVSLLLLLLVSFVTIFFSSFIIILSRRKVYRSEISRETELAAPKTQCKNTYYYTIITIILHYDVIYILYTLANGGRHTIICEHITLRSSILMYT